jgi:hypothetical protein
MDQLLEKVSTSFNLLGLSKICVLWTIIAVERQLDAIFEGRDWAEKILGIESQILR